jgi:hypothetical protein
MKTVYNSNSALIHAFAQQNQSEGRTPNGNLFFYNNKLYSYGHHYLLAEFLTDSIVLVNDDGYSVSTAKHISITYSALRQYTILQKSTHNIDNVISSLKRLKDKLLKARKPEIYISQALEIIEAYFNSQKAFNTNDSKAQLNELKDLSKVFKKDDAELKEAIKQHKKELAIQKKEAFKDFETAFRQNKPFERFKNKAQSDFDLLRLSINGENIETSQNVVIPLRDAKVLYLGLKKGENIKGQKINHYLIRDIKDDVIKIGCHNIKLKEVERLFK